MPPDWSTGWAVCDLFLYGSHVMCHGSPCMCKRASYCKTQASYVTWLTTSVEKYSYTVLWSNGRGFDTVASERHCRLRVFLTAIRQVYRHQWYSPVVHFYGDGVYRYDWRRGATNITAHERTQGRGHFSVIQQIYWENHQFQVCELCAILMAVCHLCALLLSICMCNTKGYITLSISVMHCVILIILSICINK